MRVGGGVEDAVGVGAAVVGLGLGATVGDAGALDTAVGVGGTVGTGVGTGVGAGVGAGVALRTVIVPFIEGWIAQ